jgi:hypothetical protein
MRFSSPAVVGLVTLIVYMLNAGPSFFWLDSSEFVAAAWELGVAHAPGHPLPSLLGYLFAQLPIGTIAFRVTLACAVQTALAAAVVTLIAKQLLARLREPSAPTPAPAILAELCAIAAGFVAGLSYALWFQAVRAEVYALNTLLLLVAVSLVLRYFETADRRHILAAALVYGLALCNHHLLALLALFPILLFIAAIHRAKRSGRLIVAIVAMGMLGLCTLAYLPLRAADNPRANWGNPQTIERFVFVVTAKSFQKSVERAAKQTLSERVAGAGFAVLGGLSPLGGLMALAGFYLAIRRRRSRAPALLLLTVAATNLISPVLVGFDPFNPDAHGYLSVAVAMLAPLIAVFLFVVGTTLAGTSPRRLQVASAGLTVAAFGLASMLVHINGRKTDLSQHYSAEETTRALLAAQPPGALLFTSYFESIFNIWAMQTSAGLRPDVTVVHRNFLRQPGYVESLAKRHPGLKRGLFRWRKAGRLPRAELLALLATRPVSLEYDLNIPPDIALLLRPAGLTMRLSAQARIESRHIRAHQRAIERWSAAIRPIDHHETTRTQVWMHFLQARLWCARGQRPLSAYHLQHALRLAPRDRRLRVLANQCGYRPPKKNDTENQKIDAKTVDGD